MTHNQRQVTLEHYFLSRNQKSSTFSASTPVAVSATSRVYWSPTQRHQTEKLERIRTTIALVSSYKDTAIETKPENENESAPKAIDSTTTKLKLPQLPSFNAYRLVDNKLVRVWHDQYGHEEEQMLEQFMKSVALPQLPAIHVPDMESNPVISIPGIPDSCQQYRQRRDSIEKTASENWILKQENEDALKRHEKEWKKLEISSDSGLLYHLAKS